ncbi:LYAR-type C2HC zinc finger family protein [Aspergillus niger]|uniref:LYAR-type C2HC zinc finger family protein n=1 Tax=Aspergillus niger TaxID=5061 RepID=A0A505I0V0_ASPNG|nr:LYAR-type C2HC zinc finger family protein [Aspergillus niger]
MALPAHPAGTNGQVPVIAHTSPAAQHSPTFTVNSSSDSEDPNFPDAVREDEANEVVGVSMSRAQSRMKARLTPAEEKSRMMERQSSYFDTIPDTPEPEGLFASEITDEPEALPEEPAAKPGDAQASSADLAAPQRDSARGSKDGQRTSFTRSILKSGLPLRPRAWSGDSLTNIRLKKFLPDLLTKRSSLSFRPGSPFHVRARSQTLKPASKLALEQEKEESTLQSRRKSFSDPESRDSPEEQVSELDPLGGATTARHSYARRPSTTGPPSLLRRSSSDQSLYLRASSTASSLEQRPRYEHIHSQVNSRFKAIKDSLQDSSSRLLSMPTLHLQDLRSDWGYKPFLSDVTNRRGHTYATPERPHSAREMPGDDSLPPRARSPRTSISAQYPNLTEAMAEMTGDVVILGGYRGSVLRSAKPPQRQLWVPMKVGLNLRKVDLEVGLNPEDEERMEETIIPSGVLSHVGPVDICRRLMKRLQKCPNAVNGDLRVHDYGYDWRLSPHLLAKRLVKFLEGLPCNSPDTPREKRGAYVIAHSLGGLITRHAVNQRPDLFAGVLYAGVPQHCVNILGPLRNGDDVLLSSRVLTAQVNFTFRTSFALLPEDGHCFINKRTKEEYRVDFFSAQAWDDYRLSPCINPALPLGNNRGFKDNLPLLGKRISTVLGSKDSLSSSDDANGDQASHNHTQHPYETANPSSETTGKSAPVAPPNLESAVGPTPNFKGSANTKATTTTTIPRATAVTYLERTLAEVLRFKQELAFNSSYQSQNQYPPFAVLYGKSVPTVYGARVESRERIPYQDAYDDLAFAAGDGVCLASAAMLPPGYRIIKGGLVKSDRGHVGLLGDLEGVGQCLLAN